MLADTRVKFLSHVLSFHSLDPPCKWAQSFLEAVQYHATGKTIQAHSNIDVEKGKCLLAIGN